MSVVIYGAGGNGKRFYEAIKESNQEILFFIDQFSNLEYYNDTPIVKINQVADKSLSVYVSVSCSSSIIAKQLREIGFKEVYDFNQSVLHFPKIIDVFLPLMPWYSENPQDMVDVNKIALLEELLADDYSKTKLSEIVKFRQTTSAEKYLTNDSVTQYFPEDIDLFSHLTSGIRMVDCGAFIGDTLSVAQDKVKQSGLSFDFIALMEPDSKNLVALTKSVERFSSVCDCLVVPAGVWSTNDILTFQSNGASSIVSHNSELANVERVPVVSIDQMFFGMKPNFIKMDIEGAEIEALKGAKKCIEAYSPVLAICLYHRGSDLWEIPLIIHEMNANYHYYIRVHGDVGLETVLYCVPKKV